MRKLLFVLLMCVTCVCVHAYTGAYIMDGTGEVVHVGDDHIKVDTLRGSTSKIWIVDVSEYERETLIVCRGSRWMQSDIGVGLRIYHDNNVSKMVVFSVWDSAQYTADFEGYVKGLRDDDVDRVIHTCMYLEDYKGL